MLGPWAPRPVWVASRVFWVFREYGGVLGSQVQEGHPWAVRDHWGTGPGHWAEPGWRGCSYIPTPRVPRLPTLSWEPTLPRVWRQGH